MSELSTAKKIFESEPFSVSAFGYELIREELLSELLGKDAPDILYWAGKRLARKHPLANIHEVIEFFQQAGWGLLSVKDESKNELELELTSELIYERMKTNANCTFKLEAGFLAQQIEIQKEVVAEAFEHPRKRSAAVQFTVKWDRKDPVI